MAAVVPGSGGVSEFIVVHHWLWRPPGDGVAGHLAGL